MQTLNALVDASSVLLPEEEKRRRQRILTTAILRGSIYLCATGGKSRSEVEDICRTMLALYPDAQEAIDFLATSETIVETT